MSNHTEDCSINPSIEATQYGSIDAPIDVSSASSWRHNERDGSQQESAEIEVDGAMTASPSFIVPEVKVDEPKDATGRNTKAHQ